MKKNVVYNLIKIVVVLMVMIPCIVGMVQYKRNCLDLQNNQQRYSVIFTITNESNASSFSWGQSFLQKGLEIADEFLNNNSDDINMSCSGAFDRSGCTIKYILISSAEDESFKSDTQKFEKYIEDEIYRLADSEKGDVNKNSETDYIVIPRLKNSELKYGLLGALMGLCIGLAILNFGGLYFENKYKKYKL